MVEAVAGTLIISLGLALVWVSLNLTHFLTRLVRPARPPTFVALHMTAVWSVGLSSAVCGLAVVYSGFELLNTVSG